MTQLFSNSAKTSLASDITSGAVSMTCTTGEGALFQAPTGSNYELLKLTDGTNYEIIKCTARTADTFTITRAQEGTTAQAWVAGTRIQATLTKGTLELFQQFDNGGNARGTNAVNLQSARSNVANVASGARATAIGYDTKASGDDSVSNGSGAVASGARAVANGYIASATGADAIAAGPSTVADGLKTAAVGYGAKSRADSDVTIGDSALCPATADYTERANSTVYALDAIRITDTLGSGYVYKVVKAGTSDASPPSWGAAYVTDGTVIWQKLGQLGYTKRTAVGPSAVNVGREQSFAGGNNSVAGGRYATALSGGQATATSSLATGQGKALHQHAIALNAGTSVAANTLLIPYSLPSLVSQPDWWQGAEHTAHCGVSGMFLSEPLDLAGGATWAASTTYKHGRVVKPTVPNGWQYIWYDNAYPYELINAGVTYNGVSNSASEPTWPTTQGGYVADGANGEWIAVQNSEYTIGPLPLNFVVEEVGIIVYEFDTITVAPVISFGKPGSLTLFVNNQTASNLTAANKVQRWVITNSEAVNNLTFSINTLATGTKLLCRLYWKGFYIKHWL